MEVVLVVASLLLLAVVGGTLLATRLGLRDELIDRRRKQAQLLMVWLLPVIGALIVFATHRFSDKPRV